MEVFVLCSPTLMRGILFFKAISNPPATSFMCYPSPLNHDGAGMIEFSGKWFCIAYIAYKIH